jgi:hypothetical protein
MNVQPYRLGEQSENRSCDKSDVDAELSSARAGRYRTVRTARHGPVFSLAPDSWRTPGLRAGSVKSLRAKPDTEGALDGFCPPRTMTKREPPPAPWNCHPVLV